MKKTITLIVTAMLIGGTAQATVKPQVSQPVQVNTEVSQKVEQRVRVRVSQNQKQAQKQQQSQTQANQQTTIYNEAKNLPDIMSAASIDARSPELQQSNVDRMIDAAEARPDRAGLRRPEVGSWQPFSSVVERLEGPSGGQGFESPEWRKEVSATINGDDSEKHHQNYHHRSIAHPCDSTGRVA